MKWDRNYVLSFIPLIPIKIITSLLAIYFPKILIDSIQKQKAANSVVLVIVLYFCCVLMFDLLTGLCYAKLHSRKYRIATLYQHAIIEKYMTTDYSNTDNHQNNLKYSNAMSDACSGKCAPEVVWNSLFLLLSSVFGIITYGAIVATLSPLVLLLVVISAVITHMINKWHRSYVEKNKDKWVAIDRKIAYVCGFSSGFEYAKDIKIFSMTSWIDELLTHLQNDRFRWVKKISIRSFIGACISAVLSFARSGAAYIVLILLLANGEITAGDFVFYFSAITGLSTWINGIVNRYNDVVDKSVKIQYYREYFDIKDKYNHGQGCSLPTSDEYPVEIEFEDVSFKYSSDHTKNVIDKLNLKIHKGEHIAIVGENGAGKTTLIKLLCGFYYPTEGVIKINGKNIEEYNIDEYYSLFSAVFQDIFLLPVSVAEFVASDYEKINYEQVCCSINKAGLGSKISSMPNGVHTRLMKGVFDDSVELSGGEKQKLMMARALYKDAPINILDEPTAALDPIAENELYLQYNEITQRKTAIYISHRLASTRFCDRIIYLENGHIVEQGTHDELMKKKDKYYKMYSLQSQYYKGNEKND